MEKRRISKDLWCYVGDFNAIRLVKERYGRGFVKVEWCSLPLFGRRITWVQLNGKCIIFLDRVLVSHNWKAEWGIG